VKYVRGSTSLHAHSSVLPGLKGLGAVLAACTWEGEVRSSSESAVAAQQLSLAMPCLRAAGGAWVCLCVVSEAIRSPIKWAARREEEHTVAASPLATPTIC